jgi:hypothetical protein
MMSRQIPASFGEHGPGDNTMASGFKILISSIEILSFLLTKTSLAPAEIK